VVFGGGSADGADGAISSSKRVSANGAISSSKRVSADGAISSSKRTRLVLFSCCCFGLVFMRSIISNTTPHVP
jgi:hypothetical protein